MRVGWGADRNKSYRIAVRPDRVGSESVSAKKNSQTAATARGEELPVFVLQEFLPYQISVIAAQINRLFARHYAEGAGLSIAEWRVLAITAREPNISPSAVSEQAMMDKVKVSRATAALVGRGLIKQLQHPSDGRARMLRLTKKGEGVLRTLVPIANSVERQLINRVGRNEWAALRRTIGALSRELERIDTSPPE
jgi:DNA-binding MarR family transcriptional regulator